MFASLITLHEPGLLDQGLVPATAILLRADGWDAIHVLEAGMDRAQDLEILEFARERRQNMCNTRP
jgi:predicted nuclease of predicted toxin-antitoxin system